jgi:hypothetical protein
VSVALKLRRQPAHTRGCARNVHKPPFSWLIRVLLTEPAGPAAMSTMRRSGGTGYFATSHTCLSSTGELIDTPPRKPIPPAISPEVIPPAIAHLDAQHHLETRYGCDACDRRSHTRLDAGRRLPHPAHTAPGDRRTLYLIASVVIYQAQRLQRFGFHAVEHIHASPIGDDQTGFAELAEVVTDGGLTQVEHRR